MVADRVTEFKRQLGGVACKAGLVGSTLIFAACGKEASQSKISSPDTGQKTVPTNEFIQEYSPQQEIPTKGPIQVTPTPVFSEKPPQGVGSNDLTPSEVKTAEGVIKKPPIEVKSTKPGWMEYKSELGYTVELPEGFDLDKEHPHPYEYEDRLLNSKNTDSGIKWLSIDHYEGQDLNIDEEVARTNEHPFVIANSGVKVLQSAFKRTINERNILVTNEAYWDSQGKAMGSLLTAKFIVEVNNQKVEYSIETGYGAINDGDFNKLRDDLIYIAGSLKPDSFNETPQNSNEVVGEDEWASGKLPYKIRKDTIPPGWVLAPAQNQPYDFYVPQENLNQNPLPGQNMLYIKAGNCSPEHASLDEQMQKLSDQAKKEGDNALTMQKTTIDNREALFATDEMDYSSQYGYKVDYIGYAFYAPIPGLEGECQWEAAMVINPKLFSLKDMQSYMETLRQSFKVLNSVQGKDVPADWQQFRSTSYPYEISYPNGWTAAAFRNPQSGEMNDRFVGSTVDGVPTQVSTVMNPVNTWVTVDDYAKDLMNRIKQVQAQNSNKNIDTTFYTQKIKMGDFDIVFFNTQLDSVVCCPVKEAAQSLSVIILVDKYHRGWVFSASSAVSVGPQTAQILRQMFESYNPLDHPGM